MRLSIASKVGMILAAFVLLGAGVVGFVLTTDSSKVLRQQAQSELDAVLKQTRRSLHYVYDGAIRDLQLMSRFADLDDFRRGGELDRDRISDLLESMLLKQSWYLQVRLIGADGHELVRVDRLGGGTVQPIPEAQLQDKSGRDYVTETLSRNQGEVYLSRINLNREHGHISEPEQPVVRIAGPVYSSSKPVVIGMLVINVDIGVVFDRLQGDLPGNTRLMIANTDGEYLLHPQRTRMFAFERGDSQRIEQDIPALKDARFDNGGVLNLVTGQGGAGARSSPQVATIGRMPLPEGSQESHLTLVASRPLAQVEGGIRNLLERAFLVTGLLGVLAAGVALFFAWQLVRPLRQLTEAVEAYRVGRSFTGPIPTGRQDEMGQLARSVQDMDQRIQTQMRWLKEEHLRLDSLIETATDAIIQIDRKGTIERTNSAASKLFGYTREEMLGNNVKMLMHGPDADRHDQHLRNYMRTGEGRIIGVGREVTGRHKDGRDLPLYLSIAEFEMDGDWRFTGILHDISIHKEHEQQLRQQANTDPLTEVFNRRYMLDLLQRELLRCKRYGSVLSLMLIDIDRIRSINDEHGQAAGDQALVRSVALVQEALREADILGRFGGDEFLVLMPETSLQSACLAAQRLSVLAEASRLESDPAAHLSFSIGVVQFTPDEDVSGLLKRAEKAVYTAKEAGRGTFASDPPVKI